MVDPRQILPRAWYAFFGRFHGRLLPAQRAALADVAAGRDVLLMAPTAGGKTEAVAAPLAERLLERPRREEEGPPAGPPEGPRALLVCPTRALVNDLQRRLEGPFDALDLDIARRTGDHPSAIKRRRPPDALITTPESLDSMLCRWPGSLRRVEALVLDELHMLLGSARGDQLAVLVQRLHRVVRGPLQVCVLSATLAEPAAVALRFLRDPVVHRVGGSRPLDLELLEAVPDLAGGLSAAVRRLGLRKVLAFAGRRADAEQIATDLAGRTPFGPAVFAHHGSLDRRTREWVEEQFLSRPRALCVATSTLEVGIDIGDVDAVLLLDPPPSVTALLQRVGRGSRRSGTCRALVVDRGPGWRAWTELIARHARTDDLCEDPVPFRPGVLPQQALSLVMQNPQRWISAAVLAQRLPPDARERYGVDELERVLEGLVDAGWLGHLAGDRYGPEERTSRAFEGGRLHGVIDRGARGVEVIDELTGAILGRVGGAHQGDRIAVAGRRWEVRAADGETLRVRGGVPDALAPVFRSMGGARISRRLCQELQAALGLAPGTVVARPAMDGPGWTVVHFLGSAAGDVLARAVARQSERKVRRAGPLSFFWHGDDPATLAPPGAQLLQRVARDRAVLLARRLGNGPYSSTLPRQLVERFVLEVVDPGALAAALCPWQVLSDIPLDLAETLDDLVRGLDPGP